MTGPIRQRVPPPSADERAILRRRIARQHQVPAAGGVLPAGSRNAECGLVSLPQLSAHDRDDVAVVSLRGELDSFGASVLQAHLSDIRRQAWARSVVDLADLAFIDSVCLSVLVRHCRETADGAAVLHWLGRRPPTHPEFATSGEGPSAPSPDMLTFPSSNGGGGMPGPVAEVLPAFSRKAFRVNVFGTRALMLGWRESDCPGGCLAI